MNTLQVVICTSTDDYVRSIHGKVLCTQTIDDSNIHDLANFMKGLLLAPSKMVHPYNEKPVYEEPLTENSANKVSLIEIAEVLNRLGMPSNLLGYRYLRFAIQVAVADTEVLNSITKRLYPAVAREFGTTASNVERSIRHAIEVAWDRGDIDKLESCFGYSVDPNRGRPTNAAFISKVVDNLLLGI